MLVAEGAEVLIHCGDLVDPDIIALCAVLPFYFVFGNNDVIWLDEIQAEIQKTGGGVCLGWGGTVELAGKRIAVTHGHLDREYQQLLAAEPDYLFTGHSHIAADWREGVTRRINPGALHRASSYSVALLNLQTDDVRFLTLPK